MAYHISILGRCLSNIPIYGSYPHKSSTFGIKTPFYLPVHANPRTQQSLPQPCAPTNIPVRTHRLHRPGQLFPARTWSGLQTRPQPCKKHLACPKPSQARLQINPATPPRRLGPFTNTLYPYYTHILSLAISIPAKSRLTENRK